MKEIVTKMTMVSGYLMYTFAAVFLINTFTSFSNESAIMVALFSVILFEIANLKLKFKSLEDKQDKDIKQLNQLQWKVDALKKSYEMHKDIDDLRFSSSKITDMHLAMDIKRLERKRRADKTC